MPNGATQVVEPVEETKGLFAKIANFVRAGKRRWMEQNAASSMKLRVEVGKPITVVGG